MGDVDRGEGAGFGAGPVTRKRVLWAAGITLSVLLALAGMGIARLVTALPHPPLPPLLQGLGGKGGWTDVCPPVSPQQAPVWRNNKDSDRAWVPELGARLEREFPLGSEASRLVDRLRELGFTILAPCKADPSIRHAGFQQDGGNVFNPRALPMTANIWWKVDVMERLIWTRGMVAFSGL